MKATINGVERDDIKAIHFVNEVIRKGERHTKPNGEKSYAITYDDKIIWFESSDPQQASMKK